MSIYIVQGPRILGCWGRGRHRAPGKAHPADPSASAPRFCPPGPRAPPQVFTFCSRGRTKRENNKNATMRSDPRCALCGPRGAGALWALKKGLRRGHGRLYLARSCTLATATATATTAAQRGREQSREAPRRRRHRRAQAGPGGATRPRSPRGPGSPCWPLRVTAAPATPRTESQESRKASAAEWPGLPF